MDPSVFFVGTAGSVPSARRGLTATLIRRGGDALLFDCGEGTQRQLVRSVGLADLDAIFLTHFHVDHWLGLPGMLKTFDLRDREKPLDVYGPPGLGQLLKLMRPVYGRLGYDLRIHELQPGEWFAGEDYRVAPFPVRHRGPAYGYVLAEDTRPGHFDPDTAAKLGVVPGPDFGRLQRGETVDGVKPDQVMGPPRAGRKLVLSGDTAPTEALVVAAHDADVLVHEATFSADEVERAAQTLHSTAAQAAECARQADVRLLALTHLSARHLARELRDEARAIFPDTVAPHDFDSIEVPFPERGEPVLVRWEDKEAAPA
jgi:ribonuclease Z